MSAPERKYKVKLESGSTRSYDRQDRTTTSDRRTSTTEYSTSRTHRRSKGGRRRRKGGGRRKRRKAYIKEWPKLKSKIRSWRESMSESYSSSSAKLQYSPVNESKPYKSSRGSPDRGASKKYAKDKLVRSPSYSTSSSDSRSHSGGGGRRNRSTPDNSDSPKSDDIYDPEAPFVPCGIFDPPSPLPQQTKTQVDSVIELLKSFNQNIVADLHGDACKALIVELTALAKSVCDKKVASLCCHLLEIISTQQQKQMMMPPSAALPNSPHSPPQPIDDDEIPSSAVELNHQEKYLQKLSRQERVIEEVKVALKPFYLTRVVSKDDYKEILRRAVPRICHSKEINVSKIQSLIEKYVKKFSTKK